MFVVNDDLSIYATRGDTVFFNVSAEDHGYPYKFQPGDIVRMAIYGRKEADNCVMQKDFPVEEVTETVFIYLEEEDTKIGESISKHKDYWYEVVLNPDTIPQTIIGYDEDGAKIFRLFPESEEIHDEPVVEPEDIPVVDAELDMTSHRPVENQAIARAVATILDVCERTNAAVAENFVTPEMYGAIGDGVADDTEAVQMAIDSTRPVVCSKQYAVYDSLVLGANAVIEGHGGIIHYLGTGELFTVNSNYDKRAKISGLQFKGNGDNGFIKCFNAANWGSSFVVDNCRIEGFNGNAINLLGSYSAEIRNSYIRHTSAAPFLVSTGSSITNVVKLYNTVFLGDEKKNAVFVDTTKLVCLMCDSTTFEQGNTAVIGNYPASFFNCWFEHLSLVTTNKNSVFAGCNTASCDKVVDGGDDVSLTSNVYVYHKPYMATMSKANALAEVMDKSEFTIDRRLVDGLHNGNYDLREISKMTNKGMTYNVPLNLLAHSGEPNSAGALFMYKAPPFAANAVYKLTLVGFTHYSDGTTQVTKSDAILRSGVLSEYNKFDDHASVKYAGVFGYDRGNAAFYFKNVSAGISSMDIIVEFNLVKFS